MLGTYALSAGYYDAYYLAGQKVRTLVRRDFDRAFERCDVVAGPVSPTVAFRLGRRWPIRCRCTWPTSTNIACNLAALPACRCRPGCTRARAPGGAAAGRRPFDEPTLLRAPARWSGSSGVARAGGVG